MKYWLFINILLYFQFVLNLNINNLSKSNLEISKSEIQFINFEKHSEFVENQDKYTKRCENWNLNKDQLELIFKDLESFDFNSYDYLFNRMPCWVEGKAILKNDTIHFQVNSGGGVLVMKSDSVFYFGCRSKLCKPFFIIENNSDK